ncbi:MAG: lysylphosphatidylglycerol synthase domain-containing protein [Gemmatimonadaceae bacterium]
MSARRTWKLAVALAFYALLVAFLVRYLRGTDWGMLARLDVEWRFLLLALPWSLAPRFVQPIAWRVLIDGYGEKAPPYPQLTRVYALSWLGRYIPGKVAWVGAKVLFGRDHGVNAGTLAATAVAEAILHLSTALALALLLSAFWTEAVWLGPGVALLAAVSLAMLSVAILPPVFNRVMALASARLSRAAPAGAGRLRGRSLVTAAAMYAAIHALSGIPVYLILRALSPALDWSLVPELTAAILLAGTLGTLAVFAPAGLGVREGILIVALGALMPKSVAVAGVVVLRLWSLAIDLLYYMLAAALARVAPGAGGQSFRG